MNKRPLLALLLFALAPSVPLFQGQQFTLQAQAGKQIVLGRDDIEALPRVKVTVDSSSGPVTFEGVTLKSVVEKTGIGFGEVLKGKRLTSCLTVEAADGYRVVIALPELDPDFTDKQIVLAFLRNGKPLDEKEGPYRIVIPDEKRMARWVKQVTTLTKGRGGALRQPTLDGLPYMRNCHAGVYGLRLES
jgi:hypothetical protein